MTEESIYHKPKVSKMEKLLLSTFDVNETIDIEDARWVYYKMTKQQAYTEKRLGGQNHRIEWTFSQMFLKGLCTCHGHTFKQIEDNFRVLVKELGDGTWSNHTMEYEGNILLLNKTAINGYLKQTPNPWRYVASKGQLLLVGTTLSTQIFYHNIELVSKTQPLLKEIDNSGGFIVVEVIRDFKPRQTQFFEEGEEQ